MLSSKFIVNRLFLTIVLGLIFYTVSSQSTELTKKERDEEKKAKKKANFELINLWLKKRCFVLDAYLIEDGRSNKENVSPISNYIIVDSTSCTIKIGSRLWFGGNLEKTDFMLGVDGFKIEGSINHYEITQNQKHFNNTLRFKLKSNIGNYDVFMIVGVDNTASATITSYSASGLMTLSGKFKTKCVPETD
jgi:hypothetical protein